MDTCFVSITAFCDPHLRFTLDGLFAKASRPDLLSVAVVDQSFDDNRAWLQTRPWARQVQYMQLHPLDSRGVSWARSIAFSCYRGESLLLQIDSHTHFDAAWDQTILGQLELLETVCDKPILTAYPPPFEFDADGMAFTPLVPARTVYWMQPVAGQSLRPDDVTLRFCSEHVSGADFVIGHHIAGGLLFARGHFVHEVPYDPYMYFHGEEQNIALRAFTRGWTIYNPLHDNIPIYHLYRVSGSAHPTQHWRDDLESQRQVKFTELTDRARRRLCDLVDGKRGTDPLGLGSVRSVMDFAEQSGIDYRRRTLVPVPPVLVQC